MERGIMKKSKNVTRIKCKMISLCLSSVMIISSFISINVMADSSDQIINSLTDIPAVLEDWDIRQWKNLLSKNICKDWICNTCTKLSDGTKYIF